MKDKQMSSNLKLLHKDLFNNPQTCTTIFTMVQAGILLINAETHIIVDANPWALKMIGTDREKLLGATCHSFICPEELGRCPVTDLCKQIDNSERVLITATGERIPILKTVASIDLDGRRYLIESFLDISEQEQAHRELAASEARYRDLFENANDLIQMVGPDGALQFANRSWKETLGYSDEEVAALRMQDIIHPDHLSPCMQAFQKILAGEDLDYIETTFITKDGRSIDLEGSINCNMVAGKPISSRGIFRNVTERKKAEEKRRESENRYHELFTNVSDLIQMVRPDGSFEYVNPALLDTLGYQQEDLLYLQFSDIIPADCLDRFEKEFKLLFQGKRKSLLETEFKTRTGRRIPVEGTYSVQRQGGEVKGVRFIWRNMIERKRAAKKAEAWNRKLESMVEQRTAQLLATQSKLLRAGKMAAIGGLVAGTSHELNNPLGGILNAVDLLRKGKQAAPRTPENVEEIACLDAIRSAAERCNRIVDDLRKFSEHSLCRFESLDINQLLADTINKFTDDFQQADISCEDHRNLALPLIDGDPEQLGKALENILKNSQTAILEKGQIEFSSRLVPASEVCVAAVEICIQDDGCGIPEENLEKVFDPFFTTRPAGPSTGLGLSVSYGIVKRHGGEIEIESTPGRGTKVLISLPVTQEKFSFPDR